MSDSLIQSLETKLQSLESSSVPGVSHDDLFALLNAPAVASAPTADMLGGGGDYSTFFDGLLDDSLYGSGTLWGFDAAPFPS